MSVAYDILVWCVIVVVLALRGRENGVIKKEGKRDNGGKEQRKEGRKGGTERKKAGGWRKKL